MKEANKKRNRLLLVKQSHIHNTRPFSKTHLLMLAIIIGSRQGEKQVTYGQTYTHTHTHTHTHTTQVNSVKLTS